MQWQERANFKSLICLIVCNNAMIKRFHLIEGKMALVWLEKYIVKRGIEGKNVDMYFSFFHTMIIDKIHCN